MEFALERSGSVNRVDHPLVALRAHSIAKGRESAARSLDGKDFP
jgi:hypothetical protein